MDLVNAGSLGDTVNSVNDAYMRGTALSLSDRERAARWIAHRQGLPGAYADTFALVGPELQKGMRLLTGERATGAAARHIAGEEACRALRLLAVSDPTVTTALATATGNLQARVGPVRKPTGSSHWFDEYLGGVYCCGRCSVGLWRHIAAGGFDDRENRLETGLRCLAERRNDHHSWAVFPVWYTVSALIEMPLELSRAALLHAAPRLEKIAARKEPSETFAFRRHLIARHALELI